VGRKNALFHVGHGNDVFGLGFRGVANKHTLSHVEDGNDVLQWHVSELSNELFPRQLSHSKVIEQRSACLQQTCVC
jgi:hypothetical protein